MVTGTAGAAERKTIGNSVTQLDVSDITQKQAVMSVTEVLQSKTPGVTVLPGSGAPGTAGEIRIRGAASISGYRPVVFIDGIRYSIDDLGASRRPAAARLASPSPRRSRPRSTF